MAKQYLGTPYKWGGSNYLGLDCSGLVIKVLHDLGLTVPDMTAQQIFNWCVRREMASHEPDTNCLLFFGKSIDKITHVAIAVDKIDMVEAGGAGQNSLKMTPEQLAQRDARVRIKPIKSRRDLVASILFKEP